MLDIGTKAPTFTLVDQDAQSHTLTDYTGKWVVIYFYPSDDTPGCTKQACAISEVYDEFEKMGITVFGVSKDSVISHKKFAEKYNLPFTLLSDESTEMVQAYEALVEKSMFGRKFMGIKRVTYILNPKGEVAKVYPKVTVADHTLELIKDLKELTS